MIVFEFTKESLGVIAIVLTLISLFPYIYFIVKGTIRPHAFSWLIWCILTTIGFAAQYTSNAGPGAWSTACGALCCLIITLFAISKGERNITPSDWVSLIAALTAIPLWIATNDPLWSVILISIIDVIGFWPTIRKSFYRPYEELVFTHLIGALKFFFAILAIEELSVTTWLYPASIASANIVLVTILLIRRKVLDDKRYFNNATVPNRTD